MTKVMLVEDNVTLLDSIALELEMRGYDIVKAIDGRQALDMLAMDDLPPDIIVSDIAMPNIDGYAFLEAVQQQPQWQGIPFIFLTAFDSQNAIRVGKELGADDYLVKPFQPDDLVVAMENKLRRVRQLQASAERRLDDVRRELLEIISHELRTPLTSIYAGSELLAESIAGLPDDTLQSMVGIVRYGARRMNRLVSQVVMLTQLDGGIVERLIHEQPQLCDMVAIVHEACEAVADEVDKNHISLVRALPDTSIWVKGVNDVLVFTTAEIIRNGVMYSPPGAPVYITLSQQNGSAVLIVEDQGRGIAADDIERVWERFVQIDRDQFEQQGAGLGLALVRDSVRLHNGMCSIKSQPGEGTRFTLMLPAVDSEIQSQ